MGKEHLLELADAYKAQIFTKLLELISSRLADWTTVPLRAKRTTEGVLALIYLQGSGEALDAFDIAELLREFARIAATESGLKAWSVF